MSKVKITGNASGTGTLTIAAPNTNVDRTLTLPDGAGEILVNGTTSNVGIGTSSPATNLEVSSTTAPIVRLTHSDSGTTDTLGSIQFGGSADANTAAIYATADGTTDSARLSFHTEATGGNIEERMRIDSSGNLLHGSTATNITGGGLTGVNLRAGGYIQASRDGNVSLILNRESSDGSIAEFRKNGGTVGSIGSRSGVTAYYIIDPRGSGVGFTGTTTAIYPCYDGGGGADNVYDWGFSSARWDDIYATNGTIQTSDEREKQDIDVLSDAEQRVAVAAKGLIRKYRWKDAVAEKGDDARIHVGIIAQDLKAAFEAEGLDAGRYAMFIHSEWWETYTDVPAVEAKDAVLDDDGNVIEEAVEAKEAYTRTDTYDTEAEAPEGAVKKDRMGVRYPELLAFIIGAM